MVGNVLIVGVFKMKLQRNVLTKSATRLGSNISQFKSLVSGSVLKKMNLLKRAQHALSVLKLKNNTMTLRKKPIN